MSNIDLLENGYSRLPTVLKLLPISKSAWWQGVADKRFPQPVRCGRVTMWKNSELLALFAKLEG